MTSRYLRDAYITSERIESISPECRDLWVRLLLNADDYGRFFADPRIVASKCFPLSAHAGKCARMLTELANANLLLLYEAEGKKYLQLTQWSERIRSKSKYPAPPTDCGQLSADCEQLRASADNCQPPTVTVTVPITITPSAATAIAFDAEHGWSGITETDLAAWREAYPAIDIPGEIARAREWARGHPANRKSNWRRFLVGWFGRAQDRAPPRGNGKVEPRRVSL